MKINSEQEMLTFGERFAKQIIKKDDKAENNSYLSTIETRHNKGQQGQTQNQAPIVIELLGDIGAGKTTFTRGFARGLGLKKPVTSPSYTISKVYALPHGGELIHYDFYRLENPGLMADNLREAVKNNSIVIVEWGKSVQDILPQNRIIISIKLQDDNSRTITIKNNLLDDTRKPSKNTANNNKSIKTTKNQQSKKSTDIVKSSTDKTVQLFLDTSTPTTILKLNDQEYEYTFANDLAEKLLDFIHAKLQENHKTWQDISKITFMSGPGSFTGLRIGASTVNTLAHELNIPLYDHHGKKHQIIIPEYGRSANIGKPKK